MNFSFENDVKTDARRENALLLWAENDSDRAALGLGSHARDNKLCSAAACSAQNDT